MQAVLCSNGRMTKFMLHLVKNKLLLMLVVNCCDRRNIKCLCFHLVTLKKLIHFTVLTVNKNFFRTFSSCTETNTSCSFRSNSRSILFVENGARWAGTASAELARLVREVSWEERGDKPALKERKMVIKAKGRPVALRNRTRALNCQFTFSQLTMSLFAVKMKTTLFWRLHQRIKIGIFLVTSSTCLRIL